MFTDLCPYVLHRIQFRGTGWKAIDVQTWMFPNELLYQRCEMDLVIIPDQNYRARDHGEQLLQKDNRMLRAQTTLKGANT
jgi:hypothetical protein